MKVRNIEALRDTQFCDIENGGTFTFEGEVYIGIAVDGIDWALQLSGADSGWINKDVKKSSIVFPRAYELHEVNL